ncbi:MAG: hypothetical protein KY459_13945 [Acidobacteria bacterium]|nr:hypothetical protein [Acidobacteriota bacterium]
MKRLIALPLVALMSVIIAIPASAWGRKGHEIVNEAATWGLPSEMPRFFHESYPGLVHLGYEPDRWRGAGPSIDDLNPPDHFLDYEYVEHLELPVGRYDFLELLTASDTLRKKGIDLTTAGFLPWRIAEICEKLEDQWGEWLRGNLTVAERRQVEQSIIYNAGVLGHYVADAANPHHSTIHYNGWVGVPNDRGYAIDCSFHYRFETWFVTREIDRDWVRRAMGDPVARGDYFGAAMAMILDSNSRVEDLYRIDRDGGFDPGTVEGRDFATERLATGASWLRDLWWTTWSRGTGAGGQEAEAR